MRGTAVPTLARSSQARPPFERPTGPSVYRHNSPLFRLLGDGNKRGNPSGGCKTEKHASGGRQVHAGQSGQTSERSAIAPRRPFGFGRPGSTDSATND